MTSNNHILQTAPQRTAVRCIDYTERRAWLLFDAGGELFRYQCLGGRSDADGPVLVAGRREARRVHRVTTGPRLSHPGGPRLSHPGGSCRPPSRVGPRTKGRAARFVS